jgi:hypothetical protein
MAEGYKDWSAGEILTAADLEDYTVKQSVMRFADSSARTTALSGVLAEGMVSYLKDTDSVEVYDGSAWAAVGAAAGLVLLDATDFSAASSVSVDNVFSSTYSNYMVLFSTSAISNDPEYIRIRLRVGGVDESSASLYYRENRDYSYTTTAGAAGGNYDNWRVTDATSTWPDTTSFQATLFNPAATQRTTGYLTTVFGSTAQTSVRQSVGLLHKQQSAYDGLTVYCSNGTFSGKIRIYGMADL